MDNFFNENNFKIWSKIGSRATFGLAALQLAKINENLIVVTSDVSTSAGLDRFRKSFTDKYIDGELEQPKALDMFCCTSGGDTSSFTPCPKGFFCARNCKCMVDNGE